METKRGRVEGELRTEGPGGVVEWLLQRIAFCTEFDMGTENKSVGNYGWTDEEPQSSANQIDKQIG
jgi:hypothetical protein